MSVSFYTHDSLAVPRLRDTALTTMSQDTVRFTDRAYQANHWTNTNTKGRTVKGIQGRAIQFILLVWPGRNTTVMKSWIPQMWTLRHHVVPSPFNSSYFIIRHLHSLLAIMAAWVIHFSLYTRSNLHWSMEPPHLLYKEPHCWLLPLATDNERPGKRWFLDLK